MQLILLVFLYLFDFIVFLKTLSLTDLWIKKQRDWQIDCVVTPEFDTLALRTLSSREPEHETVYRVYSPDRLLRGL